MPYWAGMRLRQLMRMNSNDAIDTVVEKGEANGVNRAFEKNFGGGDGSEFE